MQAAQEEALGCPGPAQLLRELIFYTQFHDPEESAPASDDNWEFGVPDDDFQVLAPAPSWLLCERSRIAWSTRRRLECQSSLWGAGRGKTLLVDGCCPRAFAHDDAQSLI